MSTRFDGSKRVDSHPAAGRTLYEAGGRGGDGAEELPMTPAVTAFAGAIKLARI
jgi:hypothetical protein